MILVGMFVLAGGIAALIGTGDDEVVRWFQENSSCNERPCTEQEAKDILTGIGGVAAVGGGALILFGARRALRNRDRGPSLPSAPLPQEPLPQAPASDDRYGGTFGPPRERVANSAADRLAQLDAQLAGGQINSQDYMRARGRILRDL